MLSPEIRIVRCVPHTNQSVFDFNVKNVNTDIRGTQNNPSSYAFIGYVYETIHLKIRISSCVIDLV